jgi:hypothetical protein
MGEQRLNEVFGQWSCSGKRRLEHLCRSEAAGGSGKKDQAELDGSNSRPMGPLGRKRDEEAIWGNLPKTRTNHFLIGSVTSGPLP